MKVINKKISIKEKKEAVRQFIVRAVPSVMDLKMGCVVNWEKVLYRIYHTNGTENKAISKHGGLATFWSDYNDKTVEIIGRPIQLQDVLIAIGEKDFGNWGIDARGEFVELENYEVTDKHIYWDLSQDFDHQSEAFYLLAYGLLFG